MLVKCSIDTLESENTFHSVTLVPRLDYSAKLLTDIIDILQKQRADLKFLNKHLVTNFDEMDDSHLKSIKLEHLIVFSLEVLFQIQNQIGSISSVQSIPKILSLQKHICWQYFLILVVINSYQLPCSMS